MLAGKLIRLNSSQYGITHSCLFLYNLSYISSQTVSNPKCQIYQFQFPRGVRYQGEGPLGGTYVHLIRCMGMYRCEGYMVFMYMVQSGKGKGDRNQTVLVQDGYNLARKWPMYIAVAAHANRTRFNGNFKTSK